VALDHRDIVLTSSLDGGATWSPKRRVNDDPPGSANQVPALTVDATGTLHAMWYDRRDDGGCAPALNVYVARSSDGGASFDGVRRINEKWGTWQNLWSTPRVGAHSTLLSLDSGILAFWTQVGNESDENIVARFLPEIVTAVDVSGFSATVADDHVTITWHVLSTSRIHGFRIHRSASAGAWSVLTSIAASSEHSESFSYEDRAVVPGASYDYRLEVVYLNGEVAWLGSEQVLVPGARLAWGDVRPNPSGASTQLTLSIPRAGSVEIALFDVLGRELRSWTILADRRREHRLQWDGADGRGRSLPPGVYMVRARLDDESVMARLLRIP
jgi:hypothetical protein